jgi:four helix bundle protein
MNKEQFKQRTKMFAINTARFCKTLSYDAVIKSYIDQIVRASASVGANYRAACRAKSKADFINKMRIVEEEADEALYFFELLEEFYPDKKDVIIVLYKEGNELLSMTVSSINTSIAHK